MSFGYKRIMLVEDDIATLEAVGSYFEHEGYMVTMVDNGQSAMDRLANQHYDLIVLDLMLPQISGERLCSMIRQSSSVPIIVLTAKADVDDKVMCFDLGADDYMVKPFSPRELVARAKVHIRRTFKEESYHSDIRHFGELAIDFGSHKVLVGGQEIELTSSEFSLLAILAATPGKAFTRMELVERVLGYNFEGYERTIDSHIKNLRQKTSDDAKNPRWIHTIHGMGYRFEYTGDAGEDFINLH